MAIGKFLLRRVFQGIFVIWGVITVLFALRAISPGDPATLMLAEGASRELIEHVREVEGLNRPMHVQYLDYLQDVATGDFGYSWQSSREVEMMVIERVPATIELTVAATVVAIAIAIPLGVVSATRRNEPSDYAATLFSLLGISTPNFWLGLMLILVLAVWFGIPHPTIGTASVSLANVSVPYPNAVGLDVLRLPTGRRAVGFHDAVLAIVTDGSFSELGLWLKHITLPAITLGTYFTALITRLTRSGMVDELGKPYVIATRAKGLPGVLVRYKHVLRNTMIPIITVLGLQIGTLMGGAVITETVFNWPGLGLRFIDALDTRDWPLMQGIIIFVAVAFVSINIVVDGLYAYLNPRVEEE